MVDLPLISPDPEAEQAADDDVVDPDGFVRHGLQTVHYPRGFASRVPDRPDQGAPGSTPEQPYYDGKRA